MNKPLLSDRMKTAITFSEPKKSRSVSAPEGHKRLTINLPEQLHKKLRQAALDSDCNATDIIVALLTEKLSA